MRRSHSSVYLLLTSLFAIALTGCGMGTPAAPTANGLHGQALGGNLPVQNGRVYLFAAKIFNYGALSTPLLLHDDAHPAVHIDENDNTYVLTDSYGNFDVTGDYTCPSASTYVYVLIAGGNPGISSGTDNPALALMAALGPCDHMNGSTFTLEPSFTLVNEVTTVATAYALQNFFNDAYGLGTPSTNLVGLANAFATYNNMVDNATGTAKQTVTLTGQGVSRTVTVPQDKINSLANVLVPCVNSDGGSGSPCPSLFAAAGIPGADTAAAMLAIAREPVSTKDAIWNLTTPNEFFAPSLQETTGEPVDWTIALVHSGGNMDGFYMSSDSQGNLWSVNPYTNIVIGLRNDGTPLTSSAGIYTFPTGMNLAALPLFDSNDRLWLGMTSPGGNSILQIDTSGNVLTTINSGGLANSSYSLGGISIDGDNNVWANSYAMNGTVFQINRYAASSGYTDSSGFPAVLPFLGAGFSQFDSSGDAWAFDYRNGIEGIKTDGTSVGAPMQAGEYIAGIAFDNTGSLLFLDENTDDEIGKTSTSGTLAGAPFPISFANGPYYLFLVTDGDNNLWTYTSSNLTSTAAPYIYRIKEDGASEGYGTFTQSQSLTYASAYPVLDSSGNFWNAGLATDSSIVLYEYVGLTAPTVTPYALQVHLGKQGVRP